MAATTDRNGFPRDRLQRWQQRRSPPRRVQQLAYRQLFILPTRTGLLFLLLGVVIFVLSVNYVLSLGMALSFLLFALFMATILMTFRNLYRLTVEAGPLPRVPVFAGSEARFPITVTSEGQNRTVAALELQFRGENRPGIIGMIRPEQRREQVELRLPARRRGWLRPPRVRLQSVFPTGLCRVWTDLDLDITCLVCPEPVRPAQPPAPDTAAMPEGRQYQGTASGDGSDRFDRLRDYRSGDPIARIAWKSLAGRQHLQVKQFVREAGLAVILRWDDYPGIDTERRLSWLCYRAREAHNAGRRYGLCLPEVTVPPGTGERHHGEVLRALACFGDGS